MDIDFVVIADAAVAANGKLYIHGAGWDALYGTSFPLTYTFAVALRLRVPYHDTNQQHQVTMDIQDQDGQSILPSGPVGGGMIAGRPPQLEAGADQVICLAITLGGLVFPGPGTYALQTLVDGTERNRQTFFVRQVAAPQVIQGFAA